VVPDLPPAYLQQQLQQQQASNRRNSQRQTGPVQTQQQQQQPQQLPPGTVVGCPRLKRLTLSYCKHITDRSMAHIALHASSRLESIDLTRCTTITDQGFQHWSVYPFPLLRKLCLADCTYLTDNAIVYLTNAAKMLRELDLVSFFFFFGSHFSFDSSCSLSHHRLFLPVTLQKCRILTSVFFSLQSFCCALSDTATEVLALQLPHLRRLSLAFCGSAVSDSSLRAIGLHLLELRSLSVRGCVRVTGQGVEAVADGCSELDEFDVSQCKNLQRGLEAGGIERVNRERVSGTSGRRGSRGRGPLIRWCTVADGSWRVR
jgi:F-box and leucine-rich repeat protein 7